MDRPNRLSLETSPYLKQHQHNPVDWYPWGEAALLRAREEDKPLLVSIGYSACHWCHVMERESFEDPDTAAVMNAHFVNIKVDREERPDVDQIYMDTVVRITGQGGWPLTVFCTPSGRPFYGGTYFPPEARHGLPAFRQLLAGIADAYKTRRGEVEESAGQIVEAISASGAVSPDSEIPDSSLLQDAVEKLMASADRARGGFGGAPKFPTPTNLELLLCALSVLPEDETAAVSDFLAFSCREMAGRGLYDQLGGGFHRYCVDDHWGVPHFEKMLYDQGQLMRVYADLWRRRGRVEDALIWPVRETAAYLAREMSLPDGGLAASQDADSEGVEGKFYVWTPQQVAEVLGHDADAFCESYAVTQAGNFEGQSVLWDLPREARENFSQARAALYTARSDRVWPDRDDKRIAAWNAMAASGLAYAGSLLEDASLLDQARALGRFLSETMRDEQGQLQRVYADGAVRGGGFLDDLACTTHAYLDLYRAGCGDAFAGAALSLAEDIAERFYDPQESDFFLTPRDAAPLAVRPRSDHDGATPHSAGFACLALLRCAALSGSHGLAEISETVIRRHAELLKRAPHAFPTLLRAVTWRERGFSSAVIVGDAEDENTQALAQRARLLLDPDEAVLVVAPGATLPAGLDPDLFANRTALDGRATAYVCLGTRCHLPVQQVDDLVVWQR